MPLYACCKISAVEPYPSADRINNFIGKDKKYRRAMLVRKSTIRLSEGRLYFQ